MFSQSYSYHELRSETRSSRQAIAAVKKPFSAESLWRDPRPVPGRKLASLSSFALFLPPVSAASHISGLFGLFGASRVPALCRDPVSPASSAFQPHNSHAIPYFCIRSRAGRPGHGGSLSRNWRKAAQATEVALPGAGRRPLRSGGISFRTRRKAVLDLKAGLPGPGGRPPCTKKEDDLGPAAGTSAFACEQIPSFDAVRAAMLRSRQQFTPSLSIVSLGSPQFLSDFL
jgi:hypothetical protein